MQQKGARTYLSWFPYIAGDMKPCPAGILPLSSYLPYISLWIEKILLFFGENVLFFVNQMLFSALSFLFLCLIFNRYLSRRWSLTLASLAILSFSDLPFHAFLTNLLGQKSIESSFYFELFYLPFPSLSTMIFLSLFYFSTSLKPLTQNRALTLTLAWGLMPLVLLLDA